MIRLSGSVKLRCALASGPPLGGGPLPPRLAGAALSAPSPGPPAAARASASSPALAPPPQNLKNHPRRGLKMPLADCADRQKIGVPAPGHRHKIDTLVAGPINPPRRVDPLAVRIKQKRRHHPGMVRRITPLLIVF